MMNAFLLMILFLIIMLLAKLIYNNKFNNLSPFECGFDPNQKSRPVFSLRFFTISVIFLLFDIEIAIIMPIPIILNFKKMIIVSLILYLLILLTTMLEWNEGSFSWY